MKTKEEPVKFIAFAPRLVPDPMSQGGGFKLTLEISEDQYPFVVELLDPRLRTSVVKVTIERE